MSYHRLAFRLVMNRLDDRRDAQRVAVIGSGIAGLTAAYLLSRKYSVTIYERESAVGMDAHSMDCLGARMDIPCLPPSHLHTSLCLPCLPPLHLQTSPSLPCLPPSHLQSSPSLPCLPPCGRLRVFSESYYPNMCNIYRRLGIKYHPADYSFSCASSPIGNASSAAYFRYVNAFVAGMALPIPCLLNPTQLLKCLRLAMQFAHFVRYSPAYLNESKDRGLSLASFLSAHGYSSEFKTELLLPMLSVVCTCRHPPPTPTHPPTHTHTHTHPAQ